MPKDMTLNRQSKNSVFVDFFNDKATVLQMYKELHPEATDVTIDDITIDTLQSIIVNTLYNDLGFLVKDRYVLLVEAQSTWNVNIALRMLFYLTETFRRYINDTEQSELDDKRVKLPNPELYVIYSGSGKKPDVVSLSEDFFAGNPDIELKVHVLSEENTTTLSGQYIGYCKVFDEQRKLHDDGVTAAKETYRICIEKGYLADYMRTHEKEVISMMQELFDEETLRRQLDAARSRRDIEQGKIAVAKNLIILGNMSPEDIAKVSDLTVETIKELSVQMSSAHS